MLVDKGLAQRMRRNNYYGRTALRDIFEATILLNSTTDDRTDYYIEDRMVILMYVSLEALKLRL